MVRNSPFVVAAPMGKAAPPPRASGATWAAPRAPTSATLLSGYPMASLLSGGLAATEPAEPEEPLTSAPLDVEAAAQGERLRILFIAAESTPYVKTGGMADVIGALPRALRRLGHDVRVILPRYKIVDPERWGLSTVAAGLAVPMSQRNELVNVLETTQGDGIPVYFVDAPHYFQRERLYGYNDDGERFILFCRAALEFLRRIEWAPSVIHCHDWHTGIVPNWMKTVYRSDPLLKQTATVYTIHNLAVQGIFGYRILEVAGVAEEGFVYPDSSELANVVDLMGRGVLYADAINTVSPRYASEILTPEFGERLDSLLRTRKDRLYGILNGIDTDDYDPATDRYIAAHYDAFSLEKRSANKRALQEQVGLPVEEFTPLIGMISRLVDIKGLDLLDQMIIPTLEQGVQLVISGTGDQHYHQALQRLAVKYPRQVSVHLTFNAELSQRIYAGSDLLLMPSRTEPCGSTQMLAMRYGSIPIVHRTGGLADTVQEFEPLTNTGNGFSFTRYDPFHCFAAVVRAAEAYKFGDTWHDLMQRAMLADYSWDASAERYVALYRRAQELQRIAAARVG
ncbi:MAG TPA: glycogen synthase GlgA [Ktedonobacterales bacterium]|nr:glycogen synthase GlgA [Ktedonobacterales bacterium]